MSSSSSSSESESDSNERCSVSSSSDNEVESECSSRSEDIEEDEISLGSSSDDAESEDNNLIEDDDGKKDTIDEIRNKHREEFEKLDQILRELGYRKGPPMTYSAPVKSKKVKPENDEKVKEPVKKKARKKL